MAKRFQFSLGRLMLATLFFSLTAFAIRYLVTQEHYGEIGLPAALFGSFASAGAGLGCLAGRTRQGAELGLTLPLAPFLLSALPLGLFLFCLSITARFAFSAIGSVNLGVSRLRSAGANEQGGNEYRNR